MPLEGGVRADTWDAQVTIAGQRLGTWDVVEGGQVDSNELTYKPGAMEDPVSLGGTKNVENLTFRRLYRLGRDHKISQRYINWVGKAVVVATLQTLDHDGNAWGKPITYRGTLKRVSFPNIDSQSNDAALIEIEMTIDGFPVGMNVG